MRDFVNTVSGLSGAVAIGQIPDILPQSNNTITLVLQLLVGLVSVLPTIFSKRKKQNEAANNVEDVNVNEQKKEIKEDGKEK